MLHVYIFYFIIYIYIYIYIYINYLFYIYIYENKINNSQLLFRQFSTIKNHVDNIDK